MKVKKTRSIDPQRCENCSYFHQHYVLINPQKNQYGKCFAGHCAFPRLKHVTPWQVCDEFTTEPVLVWPRPVRRAKQK